MYISNTHNKQTARKNHFWVTTFTIDKMGHPSWSMQLLSNTSFAWSKEGAIDNIIKGNRVFWCTHSKLKRGRDRKRKGMVVNMKVHMNSSSMALGGQPLLISSYAWKASIHAHQKRYITYSNFAMNVLALLYFRAFI